MTQRADATIADNRKARFDYHIDERVEAGIALLGTEIKSVRAGHVNLREGYARVEHREAWLLGVHIAPWAHGGRDNHEPLRKRKLLLHRAQIVLLGTRAAQKGYTIVPLRMYLKDGRAKVELGLARGKKRYDKREAIREREAAREIAAAVKRQVRRG